MYHIYEPLMMWGSYLVFPFVCGLVLLWKKNWQRVILVPFFLLSILFIQARFVEPKMLQVNEHVVYTAVEEPFTAVVFADQHIGVFRSSHQLQKEVEKINDINPDIVFIPGDFIYNIPKEKLTNAFAIYQHIQAPVYAVAGNHDSEQPGDIASEDVRLAIEPFGVQFIDNTLKEIQVKGNTIQLVGLSDIWEGKTDFSLLENITPEQLSIVLVHNPDAVYEFPNSNADYVFAGHTHAGQIRIPWVYKYVIPTKYPFDKGWYKFDNMRLFITAGTGMTGMPLRLLNLPQIDVIHFRK